MTSPHVAADGPLQAVATSPQVDEAFSVHLLRSAGWASQTWTLTVWLFGSERLKISVIIYLISI